MMDFIAMKQKESEIYKNCNNGTILWEHLTEGRKEE